MAIIGIGTDLVEIDRFAAGQVSDRLLRRVFSPAELTYCRAQRSPEQHLAARFAAKEAAVKALSGIAPGLLVSQVEVLRDASTPAPSLRLIHGAASPPPPKLPPDIAIHVTLSHGRGVATATVVVERVG